MILQDNNKENNNLKKVIIWGTFFCMICIGHFIKKNNIDPLQSAAF